MKISFHVFHAHEFKLKFSDLSGLMQLVIWRAALYRRVTQIPFRLLYLKNDISYIFIFAFTLITRDVFIQVILVLIGVCRASQVADVLPVVSPDIVVREARLEDCWEVAETHCSSFFPNYSFPLDIILRVDRLVGMLSGFTLPNGCKRTCLVAVTGSSTDDILCFGSEDMKIGGFDGFSLSRGYVAGILTVDTVADFLPRKGPLRQRRKGIAYVSNVAVRENFRRKGIAKRLVAKAEAQAKSWGCRAITLHCDSSNQVATKLYKSQGFKCVSVPEGAKWPQPKTSPDMQFHFMMKLLRSTSQQNIN